MACTPPEGKPNPFYVPMKPEDYKALERTAKAAEEWHVCPECGRAYGK